MSIHAATADTTKPTVTVFTVPATSSSLTISGITFTASDDTGVTGYLINESATAPAAAAITLGTAPTTYTAGSAGTKTLYAWVKDAAGNVSNVYTGRTCTIDTTPPTVTINQAGGQADPTGTSPINYTVVFSETTTNFATGDVTITGTAGGTKTATVTGSGTTYNVAVSGMTTAGTVIADIGAGVATDAAGNGNTASTSTDKTVTWTVGDTTKPTVTTFTVPATSSSLTISGITFTASDDTGVTGYLINESATPPAAAAITLGTAPTTYTAGSAGTKTLYAWVKDAANNVSNVFTGRTCTITVVNNTTASALTFNSVTNNTIGVTAPFTGDSNSNNSCVIRWGTVNGTYPNTAASSKSGNSYVATVNGLSATTTYYFQATFTDADGITGSPVTGSQATIAFVSPLMHIAANLDPTNSKGYGNWGAGKDCTWCHSPNTTNVKQIAAQIDTPTGIRSVVFSRMTATVTTATGTMGNDQRSPLTRSNHVCEVCHHQTDFHQYSSSVKAVGKSVLATNHNNRTDCVSCHPHSAGFKGSGHNVPYYATTAGHTGCATGIGCHANTNPAATYPTAGTAPDCRACHTKADPTVATNGCGSCHGALNGNGEPSGTVHPDAAGSHAAHTVLPAATLCTFCHDTGGTNGNADHGRGNRDTNPKVVNLAANLNWTGTSCSATYCHSNGTSFITPPANTSPAWAAGSVACNSCHTGGVAGSTQGPTYTTGKANSHPSHLYTCDNCHGTVVNAAGVIQSVTLHANQAYNVAQGGTSTFTLGNVPAPTVPAVCNSISCHGGAGTTATWGTQLNCQDCHGNGATASVLIYAGTFWNNSIVDSKIQMTGAGSWVTKGHGLPSGNYPGTLNNAAAFTVADACEYCHDSAVAHKLATNPFRLRNQSDVTWGRNGVCQICHATGSVGVTVSSVLKNGVSKIGSFHHGVKHLTAGAGGAFCWDCHNGHGSNGTNHAMIRSSVAKTSDGVYGIPATFTTAAFTKTAATDGSDYAQTTATASTKICQTCHTTTAHFTSSNGTDAHNFTQVCTTCHNHTDPADIAGAFPGAGDCLGCHSSPAGTGAMKRAAVAGQFASQSHHIQGKVLTKADCYTCHMEADNTGSINSTYHGGSGAPGASVDLAIHTTGARGTSFVRYTANGVASRKRTEFAKVNTHCLSCHTATNATYNAFGDGKTPQTYAWDARSIAERYTQAGTTPWGKFNFSGGTTPIGGTNAKNLVTKAFSAHGNAANNAMGGATAGTDTAITNISSNVNVLCYDCHNSHGSAASGITSQYSSATGKGKGGLVKDVTANIGGYTAAYRPAAGTKGKSSFNPGAALCFDCHNTRTNGTATLVSGTAPWGYNSTFGATQALNGYFDTPYFGDYTTPSAKRTTYKLGGAVGSASDRRKPMGGHYGTSVAGTPVSAITKQVHATTVMTGIQGLCTPCHDPHGVSTNTTYVANQTYAVPLLKGTWMTSPYKEDKADITVKRGGGSQGWAGLTAGGAIPGYHIDQNTLVAQPNPNAGGGAAATTSKGNQRGQKFAPFATSANTLQTVADTNFAGLCVQCHTKANLTDTAAPTAANWKTKNRIHQSVKGWAATTGTNTGNAVHAYTCSKCHAPHVSRLPRLMVTNCLDINHYKQAVTGGTILAANPPATGTAATNSGNILQSTFSTGKGAGRFPSGGSRWSGTPSQAQNNGPWWFVQTQPADTYTADSTTNYGTKCHNATNAGGSAYNPTNQRWNNRTPW